MNPKSTKATEIFVHGVVKEVPELNGTLKEHLTDNFGELLPHVFFGEVTRYAIANAQTHDDSLRKLLALLETSLRDGSEEIRELIGVSFVENLCGADAAIQELKPLMGPNLRAELKNFCGH